MPSFPFRECIGQYYPVLVGMVLGHLKHFCPLLQEVRVLDFAVPPNLQQVPAGRSPDILFSKAFMQGKSPGKGSFLKTGKQGVGIDFAISQIEDQTAIGYTFYFQHLRKGKWGGIFHLLFPGGYFEGEGIEEVEKEVGRIGAYVYRMSDPKQAVLALQDIRNNISGQRVPVFGEPLEFVSVVAVESVMGAHPNEPAGVLHDASDPLMGKAVLGADLRVLTR